MRGQDNPVILVSSQLILNPYLENTMIPELIGYSDKWSVYPGESVRFMVSTDFPTYEAAIVRLIHGDDNPEGPGFKEELIDAPRQHKGRKQVAYSGSYILVENVAGLGALE